MVDVLRRGPWVALLSFVMFPAGCFTSSREQALQAQIRALEIKVGDVEKQMVTRDRNIESVRGSADSVTKRIENNKYEMEELKRQLRLTQGAVDELRIKMGRVQQGGGGKVQEDSSTLKLTELEEQVAALSQQIVKLELEIAALRKGGPATEGSGSTGKTEKSDKANRPDKTNKSASKFKDVSDVTKVLGGHFVKKDYKKVVASATSVLQSDAPADQLEAALAFRAEAYFASQDFENAALDLTEFLEKYPKSDKRPRALLLAGDSFVYLKKPKVAKIYYAECVKSFAEKPECKASKDRLDRLGV